VSDVIMAAGSCILGHLLEGVRDLYVGTDEFEYVMSPGQAVAGREPLDPAVLSRCRILIEEASPWYRMLSDEERAQLPETCTQILVPTIHFNSLWPLMATDPRSVPLPHAPWGMIPFSRGDRLAQHIMKTESDPERRLQAYFSTDISKVVNIARNHELEVNNMFTREENCYVRIAAYVCANFRERRLFYTHHHPTPDLLSFALLQVLGHPAVRAVGRKRFSSVIDAVPDWVASRHAFVGEAAPIHPAVARHFALPWYREDMVYPWQGVDYTFEEWVAFYFAYEPPAAEAAAPVEAAAPAGSAPSGG
jgi:Polysaccharide biosynthesis enzyme WcbI